MKPHHRLFAVLAALVATVTAFGLTACSRIGNSDKSVTFIVDDQGKVRQQPFEFTLGKVPPTIDVTVLAVGQAGKKITFTCPSCTESAVGALTHHRQDADNYTSVTLLALVFNKAEPYTVTLNGQDTGGRIIMHRK